MVFLKPAKAETADGKPENPVAPAAEGSVPTRPADEVSGGTEQPDAKKPKVRPDTFKGLGVESYFIQYIVNLPLNVEAIRFFFWYLRRLPTPKLQMRPIPQKLRRRHRLRSLLRKHLCGFFRSSKMPALPIFFAFRQKCRESRQMRDMKIAK